jgi:hypothetical protein
LYVYESLTPGLLEDELREMTESICASSTVALE